MELAAKAVAAGVCAALMALPVAVRIAGKVMAESVAYGT